MRPSLAVILAALALTPLARAEVVEEETWYSADGKVVKTVKRTLSGADARRGSDWEPAWVRRERERDAGVRRVSYRSPRRYYRSSSYRSGCYFHPFASRYYYPRSYHTRSGFTGYLRTGSGKTRWGIGYRAPGLSVRLTR